MQKKRNVLLFVLLLLTSGGVYALDVLQSNNCTVPDGTTVEGNLYALCLELNIEGDVNGNVFAAAVRTEITGEIQGDIYLLTGDVRFNSPMAGNVHVGGGVIEFLTDAALTGESANLITASLSTTVPKEIQVGGDVIAVGYQLVMNGDTTGNLDFSGSVLSIDGTVEGDVTATVGDSRAEGTASQIQTLLVFLPFKANLIDPGLRISDDASIGGDLTYRGFQPILLHDLEQVGGETLFTSIDNQIELNALADEGRRTSAITEYFAQVIRDFTTLLLLGLFMLGLVPGFVQAAFSEMRRRSLTHVGIGLLTFTLSFPVLLLVLAATLLIIVLLSFLRIDGLLFAAGALFGLVDLGGASVFYFVAIYVSRTLVAFALGRWLVFRITRSSTVWSWLLSLAVGTFILSMLFALPVIGFFFNAVALFLGLGAIIGVMQNQIRKLRETPAGPASSMAMAGPIRTAPPIIETESRPRGMENLPSGFAWWNDDD